MINNGQSIIYSAFQYELVHKERKSYFLESLPHNKLSYKYAFFNTIEEIFNAMQYAIRQDLIIGNITIVDADGFSISGYDKRQLAEIPEIADILQKKMANIFEVGAIELASYLNVLKLLKREDALKSAIDAGIIQLISTFDYEFVDEKREFYYVKHTSDIYERFLYATCENRADVFYRIFGKYLDEEAQKIDPLDSCAVLESIIKGTLHYRKISAKKLKEEFERYYKTGQHAVIQRAVELKILKQKGE